MNVINELRDDYDLYVLLNSEKIFIFLIYYLHSQRQNINKNFIHWFSNKHNNIIDDLKNSFSEIDDFKINNSDLQI